MLILVERQLLMVTVIHIGMVKQISM
jgi:hypothetical protein